MNKKEEGERLAFLHAARLCREYREENKRLKAAVVVLSAAIAGGVIAWMMKK